MDYYEPYQITTWLRQLSLLEWAGLAFLVFTILFLINFGIRWRTYLGEPMELQYQGGYPGIEDPLDGELKLTGRELRFVDLWNSEKTHFRIPLDQVLGVSTDGSDLSTLSYMRIGAPVVLGECNYLMMRFRDSQGAIRTLQFAAHRYSKAPKIWQDRLRSVLGKETKADGAPQRM